MTDQPRKAVHVRIRGVVQGVNYRNWMVGQATALGLDGWVRNRSDGSVEAMIAGPGDAVDRALGMARQGPPAARVEHIDATPTEALLEPGFHRLPTV